MFPFSSADPRVSVHGHDIEWFLNDITFLILINTPYKNVYNFLKFILKRLIYTLHRMYKLGVCDEFVQKSPTHNNTTIVKNIN